MGEARYARRLAWYRRTYWPSGSQVLEASANGFSAYPTSAYDRFVEVLDARARGPCGTVLDLGCGTGLLLRHLQARVSFRVVPYGVDFLPEAVACARHLHCPEHAAHFSVGNVRDYPAGAGRVQATGFDFVLLDPSLLEQGDLAPLVSRIMRLVRNTLVLYVYPDVLDSLGLRHAADFEGVRQLSYNLLSPGDVSLAVVPAASPTGRARSPT
jgi:SAM-dependent methyltransferase